MNDATTADAAGRRSPPDGEQAWSVLRADYYRERVSQQGNSDDYVGLARALLNLHGQGAYGALEEAYESLRVATARHPRSVGCWEHLIMVSAVTGRSTVMSDALATLERLDPSSRAVALAREQRADDARQWADHVQATQQRLLDRAGSGDRAAAEAAVAELERWTRAFPANSMYAVNHALGLWSARRPAEAQRAARAAWGIEDGTFADAYNIGLVLRHAGAVDEGAALLQVALQRAASEQERQLVARATLDQG